MSVRDDAAEKYDEYVDSVIEACGLVSTCDWESFDAGYEAGMKAASSEDDWVKCSERLPTEADADCNGEVWVYLPKTNRVARFFYANLSTDPRVASWKPTGLKRPTPPTAQGGEGDE